MKVITVGANVYLGELEESKGVITIKNGLCLGAVNAVDKTHLALYIKTANVKKLEKDIVIRGNGAMFSERELADDLALEFQILKLKLSQAESLAVPELVNKKFDELVG